MDRSLGRIGPGLKPIEVVGANDVQDRAKKTCEYQFRYTIKTDTLAEDSSDCQDRMVGTESTAVQTSR